MASITTDLESYIKKHENIHKYSFTLHGGGGRATIPTNSETESKKVENFDFLNTKQLAEAIISTINSKQGKGKSLNINDISFKIFRYTTPGCVLFTNDVLDERLGRFFLQPDWVETLKFNEAKTRAQKKNLKETPHETEYSTLEDNFETSGELRKGGELDSHLQIFEWNSENKGKPQYFFNELLASEQLHNYNNKDPDFGLFVFPGINTREIIITDDSSSYLNVNEDLRDDGHLPSKQESSSGEERRRRRRRKKERNK